MRRGFINRGVLFAMVIAAVALGVGLYAFVANASPYRSVGQAKSPEAYGTMNVQAVVLRETVQRDPASRELRFVVQDDKTGEKMPVLYRGAIPESFDQAPRVVVCGKYDKNTDLFTATSIQTKCPSRYDGMTAQK